MDANTLTRKYQYHGNRGVQFFHQGRKRESADEYFLALQHSPSLTDPNRYQIFHGYSSLLREGYFPPRAEDFDNLKKIMRDNGEIRAFRLEAGLALGLLHFRCGDRFEAGEMYYEAIMIGEKKLTKRDKKREQTKVQFNLSFVTLESLVEPVMKDLRSNLEELTNPNANVNRPPPAPKLRSDGTYDPWVGSYYRPGTIVRGMMNENEFARLIKIGGKCCDCCEKPEGEEPLLKCSRCKKGFYCSKECQIKSWKTYGHKEYCREPGELKDGDLIRLFGLQSKPELNNLIVKVIGPDPNKEKRWEVKFDFGRPSMSIREKNIKQLRPFDILHRPKKHA